jgi:GNAT superfamily N-acetyltransferase
MTVPEGFVITDMLPGEESAVIAMVERSFNTFIAPGFSQLGVDEFLAYASAAALEERLESGVSFVLLARLDKKIAGMIEMRGFSHVAMLFTDNAFHRRGIARALFNQALERSRLILPAVSGVSVNSSPYAVGFYERLGFTICGPEQEKNGVIFTPMVLSLPTSGNP